MTITNSRGDSIKFGRHFKLIDDFDMSGLKASVNYSESTDDGSDYQNTVLENRDFEIPFFIHKTVRDSLWNEERRNEAYKVFNPKTNPHRIDITTYGGKKYYIMGNLESLPSFLKGFENDNRLWTKGLLQYSSNDPFFYSSEETQFNIGNWVGKFEFPLEIPDGIGIEMGVYSESLITNIFNGGQTSTGMTVKFKARDIVVNPSLTDVNTYEFMKLETTLQAGDILEVSTYKGNKYVELIRDNNRIDMFNAFSLDSDFLILSPGDNLFRYNADEGLDSLEVSITFRYRYLGV